VPANRVREVEAGDGLRPQSGLQDFTRLLFHGSAVAGRTDAELRFNGIIEAPDRNAGHTAMISLLSRGSVARDAGSNCSMNLTQQGVQAWRLRGVDGNARPNIEPTQACNCSNTGQGLWVRFFIVQVSRVSFPLNETQGRNLGAALAVDVDNVVGQF